MRRVHGTCAARCGRSCSPTSASTTPRHCRGCGWKRRTPRPRSPPAGRSTSNGHGHLAVRSAPSAENRTNRTTDPCGPAGYGRGAQMLTISSGELPPDAESVVAAREIVASVTEHLPRKAREAAALVTSELATNCVVHARTPFEVFAAADDEIVEVVIADRAGWAPTSRHGSNSLGNGLLLVGLLASDWAAELEEVGKRVWARLEVDDVPSY